VLKQEEATKQCCQEYAVEKAGAENGTKVAEAELKSSAALVEEALAADRTAETRNTVSSVNLTLEFVVVSEFLI
jgi:hypothetical protein